METPKMPVNIESDSDDSTESQNSSEKSSDVHLFMAEEPMKSDRDPTANHNSDAYDLLLTQGDLYSAFTVKDGNKNVWSRSDTVSHIVAALSDWTDILPDDPETYIKYHNALVDAFTDSVNGDDSTALELFGPSEQQLVAYVMESDEHSLDSLSEALEEGYELQESDE